VGRAGGKSNASDIIFRNIMSDLSDKLFVIADRLELQCRKWNSSKLILPFERLRETANNIAKSFSGSWLGYHSRVYYADFQSPPPGANFSSDWGVRELEFVDGGTRGEWREHKFEDVCNTIYSLAKVKDLKATEKLSDQVSEEFEHSKSEFLSILSITDPSAKDAFLESLKREVEKTKPGSANDCIEVFRPTKFYTHDSEAAQQGFRVPPHISVLAKLFALKQPAECCEKLAKISRRAASHLETRERQKQRSQRVGTNVFIGHGGSPLWKELKDFVKDRLQLPWDEFNRVPVAGITNIERLSQMLDEAAIAFLVMTAEDEQKDGKIQARMNVIHEAGLFQGRLGFSKAIIVLEEGCEEFTNIQGLGQIRFPKGKIKAAFEEVRQVLEREGLIEP